GLGFGCALLGQLVWRSPPDGYVAYPPGFKGAVVGEGTRYFRAASSSSERTRPNVQVRNGCDTLPSGSITEYSVCKPGKSFWTSMFCEAEGNISDGDRGEPLMDPAQSETPGMSGNSMRENRETPSVSGSRTPDRLEKATSRKASMYGGGESDEQVVPAK